MNKSTRRAKTATKKRSTPAKKKPTAKKAPAKPKTPAVRKAPTQGNVMFRLHAPDAKTVHVAGTFCNWRLDAHPLRNGKQGVWTTRLALPPGRHEYRFIVDGVWHNDPQCEERVPNPFGGENCVLHVLHAMTQSARGKMAGAMVS